MTPEGKVKNEIKAYLDSLEGCWYFMPQMMGYGRKGIPDIIGCYKGHFFAVEVKAAGKSKATTPWQDRELALARAAGGKVCVAESVEQVRELISLVMRSWT